jgi:ribonuclease HIII
MSGPNMYVTELTKEQGAALRAQLEGVGFTMKEAPHAEFGASGEAVSVTLYTSGKLVVQGKGCEEFRVQRLTEIVGLKKARLTERTIGCDEAGKGDYFGPLVVAACVLSPEEEPFLDEIPLQDSKTLKDGVVKMAAEKLKQILPHEVIVIGPRRYNEMYESFRNVNSLLAWAHAKAMLAVAEKTGCRTVVLDQFADRRIVEKALGARKSDVDLTTMVRAEAANPAVAAASILARSAFLWGLHRLKDVAGMPLPKGAGSPVLEAGKKLLAAKGRVILPEVAKLHFKTTQDIS